MRNVSRLLAVCTAASLCLPLLRPAFAAEDSAPLALASDGSVVAAAPLDDPQNPYRGQYSSFDRWVYANYIEVPANIYSLPDQGMALWQEILARYPEGSVSESGEVDARGWLLPAAKRQRPLGRSETATTLREYLDSPRVIRRTAEEQSQTYHLVAVGLMPPEVRASQQEDFYSQSAALYPRIPAWLGQHPPLLAVFVPNGEILTYGPLDLHIEGEGRYLSAFLAPGELWYRYTAAGQLLGTHKGSGDGYMNFWQGIYDPQYAARAHPKLIAPVPQPTSTSWAGMLVLYEAPGGGISPASYMDEDSGPAKILAAFDYDGTVVDPDQPIPAERRFMGQNILREQLAAIYAVQARQGLTASEDLGPYWGQPAGPQRVDPAPRKPKKIARRGQAFVGDYVVIGPLDDPANPYRDSYGPWDHWRLNQVGQNNPRAQEAWSAQVSAQYAELAKAKAEKREPDPRIMEQQGYRQPPDDPWQHFDLYVTPEGWLLPAAESWQRELRHYGQDLRQAQPGLPPRHEFHAQSGGVMDEATASAEASARQEFERPFWPVIPAWLAAQPVHCAVFLPDGSILCLGDLGSRPVQSDPEEYRAALKAAAAQWHRYSPQGELLAQFPCSSEYRWQTDLTPGLQQVIDMAKLLDQEVGSYAGYLLVHDQAGKLLSAFDYDGAPVDLSQPILREKLCQPLFWEKIMQIYELQQQSGQTGEQ